ncbi:hypothetical protein OIU35_31600 [Boseaceae bacterium BT-24-1]|nr:hypothetical protein [Boseaceae bacterium BT-24-1]
MSAHAEFERKLRERLQARVEELGAQIAKGSAQSFDDYRERVGVIRGLLEATAMIEEVTKHVEERIRR